MVCEDDEPDVQIGIPAVMLPQDVGAILENDLMTKSKGMCFFFFLGLILTIGHASPLLWIISCLKK